MLPRSLQPEHMRGSFQALHKIGWINPARGEHNFSPILRSPRTSSRNRWRLPQKGNAGGTSYPRGISFGHELHIVSEGGNEKRIAFRSPPQRWAQRSESTIQPFWRERAMS